MRCHGLPDLPITHQDQNRSHIVITYSDIDYENNNCKSDNSNVEKTYWRCGTPHDPLPAYRSTVTCPRSCPRGVDAITDDEVVTTTQSHPTSAYFNDGSTLLQNQIISPTPSFPFGYAGNARFNLSSLDSTNESLMSYSPTPSLSPSQFNRPDFRQISTPDSGDSYDYPTGLTMLNSDDTTGDACGISEPYAQLIFKALMSAPGHKMVLREIYEWFEKNTDKADNKASKGWQNSIRHNLSMNKAFQKVEQIPPTNESKKGYIWVLEQFAIENGYVESTTRYRKQGPSKKGSGTESTINQRQRSGAKGGRTAKRGTRLKRTGRYGDIKAEQDFEPAAGNLLSPLPSGKEGRMVLPKMEYPLQGQPYFVETPDSSDQFSLSENSQYGFGGIAGCVSDSTKLFLDGIESSDESMLTNQYFGDCGEGLARYNNSYLA